MENKKIIEEFNRLLKVRLYKQGENQWRLVPVQKRDGTQIRRGEIIFRGDEEKLKLLLRRLKAKDNETDPPSVKNRTYQQMIDGAKDKSDPWIWIELKDWNKYRNNNKITTMENYKTLNLEINKPVKIEQKDGALILERGDKIRILQ